MPEDVDTVPGASAVATDVVVEHLLLQQLGDAVGLGRRSGARSSAPSTANTIVGMSEATSYAPCVAL